MPFIIKIFPVHFRFACPKYCPIILQMDVKAAKKAVIEGIQCIKVNYYLLLACLGTTSLSLYCKREDFTSTVFRILLSKWVQFSFEHYSLILPDFIVYYYSHKKQT